MWTVLDSGAKAPRKALLSKLLTSMLMLTGWSLSGCVLAVEDDAIDDDVETSVITEQVTWSGHDYLFVSTPKSWSAAKLYCALADGGSGYHLVIINDANEEMFLNTSESGRGLNSWWIGLTDDGLEGSWLWDNATPLTGFTNWKAGQPDDYNGQDCVLDRSLGTDNWSDQSCETSHNFICERDAIPSTSSGSFSYSRSSTNNATINTHQNSVYLYAGYVLTVGTCGLPGASVTSGDTWLLASTSVHGRRAVSKRAG